MYKLPHPRQIPSVLVSAGVGPGFSFLSGRSRPLSLVLVTGGGLLSCNGGRLVSALRSRHRASVLPYSWIVDPESPADAGAAFTSLPREETEWRSFVVWTSALAMMLQHSAVGEGTAEVAIGGMTKPPAQLARVVAPPSHPYERGGGMRWLVFVACKRL